MKLNTWPRGCSTFAIFFVQQRDGRRSIHVMSSTTQNCFSRHHAILSFRCAKRSSNNSTRTSHLYARSGQHFICKWQSTFWSCKEWHAADGAVPPHRPCVLHPRFTCANVADLSILLFWLAEAVGSIYRNSYPCGIIPFQTLSTESSRARRIRWENQGLSMQGTRPIFLCVVSREELGIFN